MFQALQVSGFIPSGPDMYCVTGEGWNCDLEVFRGEKSQSNPILFLARIEDKIKDPRNKELLTRLTNQ